MKRLAALKHWVAPCLFLLPLYACAQDWRTPLDSTTQPNFFQIQADFNQYWAGKKPEKGSGWKVFKRWEWFWGQRVYPDGRFPAADANAAALQAWLKEHPELQQRGGSTRWTSLGPNYSKGGYSGTGRINCLAIHPQDPNILWAGTPAGGLWKSETGGNNWVPMTDQHPSLGVAAIVINPFDPKIMYIATGDSNGGDTFSTGVWRSTDGGETWTPTGLQWPTSQQRNIRALVMNPVNPQRLVCGASDGIYYTANGGQTWSRTMGSTQVSDLEMRPENPHVLYACTNGTVHRSVNGGLNWQSVLTVPGAGRIALCVSPANSQWVGVLCSSASTNRFHSFWSSTNGGQAFAQQSNSPNILGWSNSGDDKGGQGWYDLCVAASPDNANEIYTGGINIWKSKDGGRTWAAATHWYNLDGVPEVHADQHTLLFGPNGSLYNGNDGGIYSSMDGGESFGVLTGNLVISQMYRTSVSQKSKAVITGLQDNGTKLLNNSGTWSDVLGGDGMDCLIDPTNPNRMYGSSQNGRLHRSINGGANWNHISESMPDTVGAWITPYILNPKNLKQIWAGYQGVWRSNNYGDTWKKTSATFNPGTLQYLAMSAADTTRLYAATTGNIWRSDDSGKNWISLNPLFSFGSATRVAVHPENASEVYVTFSGYSKGNKVMRSRDAGQTWENISGALPNVPTNCLIFHQNGKNGYYVGTDIGVFYRDSTIEDWVRYNDGLPNAPVVDLDIRITDDELVAATYGRGLWMIPTLNSANIQCPDLGGFAVLDTTFTTATLKWDDIGTWGYQYRLRPVGAATWTVGPTLKQVSGTPNGLNPGAQYEVQIRAQCQGKDGAWGPSHLFSTRKMEGLYCASFGSAVIQWIDSLSFANIRNPSGNNDGYGYFTDTIRVTAGQTYPFAVLAKSVGNPATMFWRAWMDTNFDQDFEDAGELLFQRATTDPAAFSRTITIPANIPAGITRFRISMGSSVSAVPCYSTPQTRDVEDYVVSVSASSVATQNPLKAFHFEVQPNPAGDFIYLLLPSHSQDVQWRLIGADGRVHVPMQPVTAGSKDMMVPVKHLPGGLYWIQVLDDQGNSGQRKFVKI